VTLSTNSRIALFAFPSRQLSSMPSSLPLRKLGSWPRPRPGATEGMRD
jgi:hypothetical protein